MAPPALQTSDLISDISAVIATGTSLHPATSSASAGYFCLEVPETWQAKQQHKPRATSSTLWAKCAFRLCPNLQALPAPLRRCSLFLQNVAILILQITNILLATSTLSLVTKKNSLSHNFMTSSVMALSCVFSLGRLCLVGTVCAWNRMIWDMI